MAWADIPGIAGYQASDDGRIRSRRRVLKQWADNSGKMRVQIRSRPQLVHLLVLSTFSGPRPEGGQPIWENGDKMDNRLENLAWRVPTKRAPVRTVETPVMGCGEKCTRGHSLDKAETWGTKNRICRACVNGVPPIVDLPEVL